ncbi:hypothetical protein FJ420_11720 [Mesorhizobium sp. B3-1-3]|uniref:hypothetical protein n=1 Tax=unclassified Mesorhizobium TaxID=325217 RepID=UPI001126E7A8|nr:MULTISPECIES: hypothetical protein [unclassified Mesorhizobium]TPI65539.1 hypothetical protein FJ424_16160 [Mesorhizobium sp. B3-1-8]TPI72734.1 hypothetical protein FJ420_11720 [Mesorhizobium sp. B3-1-3]
MRKTNFETASFNESSLSRVWHHTHNSNIGLITAFQKAAATQENPERNSELAAAIRGRFGYIKVRGRLVAENGVDTGKSIDDESFLLVGNSDDSGNMLGFLRQQGQRFEQNCVLYKPHNNENAYILGTREGGFPRLRQKHKAGLWHPNRMAEYYPLLFGAETVEGGDKVACHYAEFRFYRPLSFFSRVEAEF